MTRFIAWWDGVGAVDSRGAILLASADTPFARVLFVPWALRGAR